jgi:hypothetical protein
MRSVPTSTLLAITLADGTLAPVWSVTVPDSPADTWAEADDKVRTASTIDLLHDPGMSC